MSLESAIADLVSASTSLTQAVNITKATVEATRDSAIAKEAPVTTAKDATVASATAATTDTATTASKLTAAAADYAAQKTTKGLAAVQTSAESELKDRLHRRDPARHPFRGARPSLVMDFVRRECHRNNAAGNLEPVDLNTFMTFTRGSTATYVGPDGLIKEAAIDTPRYGYDPVTGEALGLLVEEQRTNLTAFSSQPMTSGWAAVGGYLQQQVAVAPDGSLTGFKLVESSINELHEATCFGYTNADNFVTVSVYIKPAGRTFAYLRLSGNSKRAAIVVDLANKTFTVSNWQNTLSTSGSVVSVGGGWLRIVLTAQSNFPTAPGFDTVKISALSSLPNVVDVAGGGYAYAGDGVSGIYIWGAQVEAGAFPTSYIPTPATFTGRASTKTYFDSNGVMQTAASGVAATDYGYVDGRWISKGLSLEGQATNLIPRSSLAVGTATAGATTTAVISSGSIGILADTQCTITGSEWVAVYNTAGFGGLSLNAGTYTYSVFSTKATPMQMLFYEAAGYFTSTVVACGGGLYRHFITLTLATTSTCLCHVRRADGHVITGFQLEVGSYPTSYIPTTTAQVTRAADTSTSAQVTRAADDAKLNSITTWYNQDCGASVLGYRRIAPYISGLYPGGITFGGDMASYFTTTAIGAKGRGVTAVTNVTSAAVNTNGLNAIQTNRDEIVLGAVNGVQHTSLKKTTYVTYITLGRVDQYLNGYIRQLTYFPRQLSDADLQALTILED